MSTNILPNRLVGLPYFVMTTFLKYTTEWIGRTTIFCNDKIPQLYYRMDWKDYHILLWQEFSNILPNRLVGLPYFIMTTFLKYTTEWIGRILPYFVMTKFLKYTTEWIGRTTIFCNDKISQIYYRMDW